MAALLDTVELKKVLRALLVSMPSPTGMSLQGLLKEYQDFEGTCLPYAQFGYSTPLDFLRVMSDTVQLRSFNGETYVSPVINQDTAHIAQLVKEQKSRGTRKRGSHPQTNAMPAERGAVPERRSGQIHPSTNRISKNRKKKIIRRALAKEVQRQSAVPSQDTVADILNILPVVANILDNYNRRQYFLDVLSTAVDILNICNHRI